MISYLYGQVAETLLNSIILEVNDIGYHIYMTDIDISNLMQKEDKIKVYTYMQVKEDGITLFGFLQKNQLEIFNKLCEVNGIGAKMAINILSKSSIDDLVMALETGDIDILTKCPGIGKKTAQRMILELKGKLVLEDSVTAQNVNTTNVDEAIEGLVNLGFNKQEVTRKISSIKDVASKATEEIITEVLRMK